MKCPKCGSVASTTTNSQLSSDGEFRWRRRKCKSCGFVWYTTEKRDGCALLKDLVVCEACIRGGECEIEEVLREAGQYKPYCSAGKRRVPDEQI